MMVATGALVAVVGAWSGEEEGWGSIFADAATTGCKGWIWGVFPIGGGEVSAWRSMVFQLSSRTTNSTAAAVAHRQLGAMPGSGKGCGGLKLSGSDLRRARVSSTSTDNSLAYWRRNPVANAS